MQEMKQKESEIERHLNHVERKLEAIQDEVMKYEVQEFMISNEEQMDNLKECWRKSVTL